MEKIKTPLLLALITFLLSISVTAGELASAPSPDDDAILGNPDAPVLIIWFGDIQEPITTKFYFETFPLIKENYIDTGKVKAVYRDFPLNIYSAGFQLYQPLAYEAAEAAECAGEQEKYWEYLDLLFKSSPDFTLGQFRTMAKSIGLDVKSWTNCFSSHAQKQEVLKDKHDGLALGVVGTPQFFLWLNDSGQIINGAHPYKEFATAIEGLLWDAGYYGLPPDSDVPPNSGKAEIVNTCETSKKVPPGCWEKKIGIENKNVRVSSSSYTSDGGVIVGLERYDIVEDGEITTMTVGPNGETETSTEKAWKSGKNSCWIVKLDRHGKRQWDRTFDAEPYCGTKEISETNDGGFLVNGFMQINNSPGQMYEIIQKGWLLKLDSQGNIEWEKLLDTIHDAASVTETAEGGYIALGGYDDLWVLKFSPDGFLDWEQQINVSLTLEKGVNFWGFEPPKIIQTIDGGYTLLVVYGSESSGTVYKTILIKLNAQGEKEWEKNIEFVDAQEGHLTSLLQTKEGGYLSGGIAGKGFMEDEKYSSGYVVKLDATGNKEWEAFLFEETGITGIVIVKNDIDGGHIVTDGFVMLKLDSLGNVLWETYSEFKISSIQLLDKSYQVLIVENIDTKWPFNEVILHNVQWEVQGK